MHTQVCDTLMRVAVDRLSVTVDAELGRAVREAAHASGMSVSSWVAAAIEFQVRNRLLGEALDAWEAETGPFPPEAQAWADNAFAEVEALQRALGEEAPDRLAG